MADMHRDVGRGTESRARAREVAVMKAIWRAILVVAGVVGFLFALVVPASAGMNLGNHNETLVRDPR
jgi:hypothetical protein